MWRPQERILVPCPMALRRREGPPAAAPLLVLGTEGPVPGAFEVLPEPGRPASNCGRPSPGPKPGPGNGARAPEGMTAGVSINSWGTNCAAPWRLSRPPWTSCGAKGMPMRPWAACWIWRRATWTVSRARWNGARIFARSNEAPPVPKLDEVPVGDLVSHLEKEGRRIGLAADPACPVLTDPALMATVAGQLERVVATCYPRRVIDIVIAASDDRLTLILTAEGDPRPVGGLQRARPTARLPRWNAWPA